MQFLIVDDEPLVLRDIAEALKEAVPGCEVRPFSSPYEALDCVKKSPFDAAFLDIELGCLNGIALAKKLKDLRPEIHIIFVTGYRKYAVDAFSVHATGYLLKPASTEDIRRELTFLYKNLPNKAGQTIRVQTFGGFDIFVNGTALVFNRAKSKELLAYLIDRRGVSVTTREACAILWEDAPYDTAQKNYFQTVLACLRSTLQRAGIGDILIKNHNTLAIDPEKLLCDSYQFWDGDPLAVNQYRRDYMACYSWAEFTLGQMEQKI